MMAKAQQGLFGRERLLRAADWLAVATAASLPWSTSATSILVVLWLVALMPAIEWRSISGEQWTAASALPLALVALGIAGMTWADVSLAERIKGAEPFLKLLLIPLLFLQFRASPRGHCVFIGYVVACAILVVASYIYCLLPGQNPDSVFFGVPVKNGATQSGEFVTCIFGLSYAVKDAVAHRQWPKAALLAALLLAMLANIIFVATGRTAFVMALVLLVLFAATQLKAAHAMAVFLVTAAVVAAAWFASPYLRERTTQVWTDFSRYEATDERNSSGERVEFWKKSMSFIADAPIIGHGTGTIPALFAKSAVGKTGAAGVASTNPHNQTLAVGIELGLIGIAVLWSMWIVHLLLFRGGGLAAWIGLLVVVQNIVGSLFNSHLFDFNQGWVYVIGVGVAGGLVLRQRATKTLP